MNDKLRELVEAAFREGFLVGEANQASCDIGDIAILLNKAWLQSETRDVLFATALEAEPDGWQPIETAPYGVTVAVSDGIEIDAGWRDEASGMWTAWGGDEMALIPTIYCSLPPLPAPPKGIPNGNS